MLKDVRITLGQVVLHYSLKRLHKVSMCWFLKNDEMFMKAKICFEWSIIFFEDDYFSVCALYTVPVIHCALAVELQHNIIN